MKNRDIEKELLELANKEVKEKIKRRKQNAKTNFN